MHQKQVTIPQLLDRKKSRKKIVALTAYDYSFARILDQVEVDVVLVGDSVGMVSLGYENTLPVTMEEMLHHTRAVKRGINNALLVGDMPYLSYQISDKDAIANAGRFIKDGAHAIKIEGGVSMAKRIRTVVQAGVSVMGHIGLTPQSIHQFGGYKVQGKNYFDAKQIKTDALTLQHAGVFSLVLEGIPTELAGEITQELEIPTIGIGAGPNCDGQILVLHDMVGFNLDFQPKFVKRFANLGHQMKIAVKEYIDSVNEGSFPGQEHSYSSDQESLPKLKSIK